MGLCLPEITTKLWNFAAGMDFDTTCILNKMSQMYGFCPSNSVPTIFYGNNRFRNKRAIKVAQNCLKLSVNQIFGNFKLPLWIFQNKLNHDFYLNNIGPWSTMKPEKMQSLSEAKVRYYFPKKCKISLLPCFWANKYDYINNIMVRFIHEDDVTTSWILFGNIYIKSVHGKIPWLPWLFRVKFYIISHDFWENHMDSEKASTDHLTRIINMYTNSHDTGIAN